MSRPNPSELAILKCLWGHAPQSARDIHNTVGPDQGWKVSTTRTVVGRMEAKGWLSKTDAEPALYSPELERVATLGEMVRHLARQVLDIDGALPAALFTESPHLSAAELDELDAIINAASDEEDGA